MTRRDYIFLAESFAATLGSVGFTLHERRGVAKAARDLAYKLALANPRFDQVLFLTNCGIANAASAVMEGCPSYGGTSND
ncbi:MAG: hypothetical protein ACRETH_03340 [Steroidobacteraceae bacterium]